MAARPEYDREKAMECLVQAACLTAFMTPMATGAVPYMMEYGGYDQKTLIKGGWLYAIVSAVITIGWIMTVYPVM